MQRKTGTQIDIADYLHLLTDFEQIQRGTPQFRTFVQQYLKQVTVYPDTVIFTLNTGYGISDITEDFFIDRQQFRIPNKKKAKAEEMT